MLKKISIVIALIATTSVASASTWDLADDFSLNTNPNGQWSYGYTTTPGSTPTLFSLSGVQSTGYFGLNGTLTMYTGPDVYGTVPTASYLPLMGVFFGDNKQGKDIIINSAQGSGILTLKQKRGYINMHPSQTKQAVARWTAPVAGTYVITASFYSLTPCGPTTNVYVYKNGVALYKGYVNGSTGYKHYASPETGISLAVNDKIDFIVNGPFGCDSTGVDARIRNVNSTQ